MRIVKAAEAPPAAWVVDASVALKWVRPEPGSEAALAFLKRVRAQDAELFAPDLWCIELASALWKKATLRGRDTTPAEAMECLHHLLAAPVVREPLGRLAERALDIALELGVTAYDASYLALAEFLDAPVVTFDRQLAQRVSGSRLEGRMVLLAA